jgi:hypothetical protein
MGTTWLARLALIPTVLVGLAPHAASAAAQKGLVAGKVVWVRVDPAQPNTLYAGVDGMLTLIKRSTDGGASWQFLPTGAPRSDYWRGCDDRADPPIIALGGHDLYTLYDFTTDPVCRTGEGAVAAKAASG